MLLTLQLEQYYPVNKMANGTLLHSRPTQCLRKNAITWLQTKKYLMSLDHWNNEATI
jgi:hypothetical protein